MCYNRTSTIPLACTPWQGCWLGSLQVQMKVIVWYLPDSCAAQAAAVEQCRAAQAYHFWRLHTAAYARLYLVLKVHKLPSVDSSMPVLSASPQLDCPQVAMAASSLLKRPCLYCAQKL